MLVEDRMRTTARTIKSNFQSYSGDKIGLAQLPSQHQAWNKKYILSFFQHKFSEDDTERESESILYFLLTSVLRPSTAGTTPRRSSTPSGTATLSS